MLNFDHTQVDVSGIQEVLSIDLRTRQEEAMGRLAVAKHVWGKDELHELPPGYLKTMEMSSVGKEFTALVRLAKEQMPDEAPIVVCYAAYAKTMESQTLTPDECIALGEDINMRLSNYDRIYWKHKEGDGDVSIGTLWGEEGLDF